MRFHAFFFLFEDESDFCTRTAAAAALKAEFPVPAKTMIAFFLL